MSDASDPGPWGESARHLSLDELERGLATLAAPKDRGRLEQVVARCEGGVRETPGRVHLTPEEGVPGDAWQRDARERPEIQIAMMRADVGRLIANGQSLTLFGDNLLVDLDLSVENLPVGSLLQIGEARLEVTPEPHDGCQRYHQRFGRDALHLTAKRRELRLRGVYVRVVQAGEVAVGDPIELVRRGSAGN